jgi:RecJ-like exonuclease
VSKKVLKQIAISLIENNLKKYFNTTFQHATNEQLFKAIASVAIDELFEIRGRVKKIGNGKGDNVKKPVKKLHY